ncbi:MAG: DNA alkylation repair protein [Patescibacteria group bacterium]
MDRKAQYNQILKTLKSYANKKNVAGMARFGIKGKNVLGGPNLPTLRKMAKEIGKNHELALRLWDSEIHEARILAGMIAEPDKATEQQLESWVKEFDSWDVCDQVCSNFFDKTKFAYTKAEEWSKRKEEFIKRAGLVLMACLAVHDKMAEDKKFIAFLKNIKRESVDERNFVRKAVNWALRQIGKRNIVLNELTIKLAEEILRINSKSAKWIAGDALRELKSEAVQNKF